MYHLSCDEYPVVGWLVHDSLKLNQKIHRASLFTSSNGRINAYYHMERFIMECDTNGDFNPNEYFIFELTEREDIYKIIDQLLSRLGIENPEKTHSLTEGVLDFISKDFSI